MSSSPTAPREYRLASASWISAPGTIAWAAAGYWREEDQASLRSVITSGWGVPDDVVHKLLTKEVPYEVTSDEVVKFTA